MGAWPLLATSAIVAAVGSVNLLGRVAFAQSAWDRPEFKQATEAIQRQDCKGAWEVIWPLAKAGSSEARYFLLGAIIDILTPPGVTPSQPMFARHMLTLGVHGSLTATHPVRAPKDWPRKAMPLLVGPLSLGAQGDRVVQCYKTSPSFQTCIDLAVSLGVVQKFEDYARNVERAAEETGVDATCRPRPW
jgi:hypothetical protein